MRLVRRVLGPLLALLVSSLAAFAQVTTADIVGRVADDSGAILPGATVTVQHAGTGATRTVVTTETGDYVFNLLPIGSYEVRIELQGFQTQTAKVTLASGDRARVDAKLQLGTLTETVQVSAEAPLLQTDTSTLSALVTEKAVQDLPVTGRNFVRLIQLVPGASEGLPNALGSGTRPDDRRQTSAVSINGANDNQNNQMIDGMDNNERAIGTIGVKPSIDAIAEVRVQTNLYSAEVGRTAGGIVNILTKSGTNQFNGTVFEFFRNDRFDARNFFATTKPTLRQHQFGGSLGGPIRSDRTFFFADVEGFTSEQGITNLLTVPTMRMRQGDFSELSVPIYDPATSPRTPFPGNVIPRERLDPIALQYMALYPTPTSGGFANNYASVTDRTQDSWTGDVRVDHRFNDNNQFYARYSMNTLETLTPGGCPATADGVQPGCLTGPNQGHPGPNTTDAHGLHLNYVRVFSPTLIAEARGGYLKTAIESLPLNYGRNLSQQFGLRGVNVDDISSGLGLMVPTGYALLGDQVNIPLINRNDTSQFALAVTKTRGAHNVKMGGGVIMRQFSVIQSASPVGQFTFDTLLTNNGAGAGGNAIASFLLGVPSQAVRLHTPIEPKYHTNEPSLFVQDDWRATSWLTVNAGLRYDVFTPFTEEDNQMANLDLNTGRVLVAGQDGVSRSAGVKTDYSNIAPRFGFSATLPYNMVARGGYGLTYFPGNIASFSYMKNAPFTSTYGPVVSVGASGGAPSLRLADGLPAVTPGDTSPTALTGTIRAVDVDFKSTRVQQFNLMVEKEFGGNVVSAGYVGSRGARVALNNIPNVNLAPAGPGAVQPRRRYSNLLPNLSAIALVTSQFESRYDAMQLVFQRRYRGGLTFNTHYTLGHTTATAPTPWDVDVIERFDWDNDVRHRWVLTANYELPWGRDLTGIGGAVLAGWQVNAVAFWQSGLPFDVVNAAARTNTGGNDRPNLVADPELPADERSLSRWFNTAAFQAQPQFTAGNTPRNVLHGPSQRRLDLSLFKDFGLGGDARLQVRAEVYNVTNTTNFANPNGSFGSPAFGTISSTGNAIPRQMQFGLKLLF